MLDPRPILEALKETEPNKLRGMPPEKLMEYEQYFAQLLAGFGMEQRGHEPLRQGCQARMESLGREIQHRESMRLGRWTFWVAVAAVFVPVFVAVTFHILSSRPQPSKTDLGNSPSTLQTPPPTAVSPEPEASSKIETPSQEQSAIAQPTLTAPPPTPALPEKD